MNIKNGLNTKIITVESRRLNFNYKRDEDIAKVIFVSFGLRVGKGVTFLEKVGFRVNGNWIER